MWETDESDILREMDRVNSILEEIYSGSINWLYDLSRNSLKPLYKLRLRERELEVTFDLPGVRKEDISISATDQTLSIEAKTERPIRLMVGGFLQKSVEFERYFESILLPVRIDPDKAKAKVRNGHLTIRFPVIEKGTVVKVE
jgi:HSP20 family molecular chaperone IbpA